MRTEYTFEDFLREQIERDPKFEDLYAEAGAELDLAIALYYAREAAGLSQRELAERAGIPPRALRSIEKAGRTPKLTTLWRLADALGIEIRLKPGRGFELLPAAPANTGEEANEQPKDEHTPASRATA
jgi:transcriptional regulator with XRE-family HTH domain